MEHIATCTLPSRLSSASWKKEKHIFVSCHAKRVLELNTGTCEFWCISLYVTRMRIPWKILPALVSIYILHATEKVDWIKSILCSLCNIKNTDCYHSSLFLPSTLQHQWNFHQLYSLLKMPTLCFFWAFYYFVKGPNNVIYTQIFSDKRNQLPWTVLHWQTTRKATDVNWRGPSSSWIISSQYYASAVKQARAF